VQNDSIPTEGADITGPLIIMECLKCGIEWAITQKLQRELWVSGATFYCPRGHKSSYGPHLPDSYRPWGNCIKDNVVKGAAQ
jgi:hypothetical protein